MYDSLFKAYIDSYFGGKAERSVLGKVVFAVVVVLSFLYFLCRFLGRRRWGIFFFVAVLILMVLLIVEYCLIDRDCFSGNCCCRRYFVLSSKPGNEERQSMGENKKIAALNEALTMCAANKSHIMDGGTVDLLIEITKERKKSNDFTGELGLGSIGAMLVSGIVTFFSTLIPTMGVSDISIQTVNMILLLMILIPLLMWAVSFLCSIIQGMLDRDYNSFLEALYDYKLCLGLNRSMLKMDND